MALIERTSDDCFRQAGIIRDSLDRRRYNAFKRNVSIFMQSDIEELSEVMSSDYEYIIIDFGNDYADNRPFFLLCSIKIVIGNLSWWKLQHYVAFIAATEKEQSRKHWKFLGTVSSERTIRYMGKKMRTAIRPVPYEPDPFFLTGETMNFLQELLE